MEKISKYSLLAATIIISFLVIKIYLHYAHENKILKEVISRLEADSRIAEVLVTGVNYDDGANKLYTTIKFLEYDIDNQPLIPRYFTFQGNVIQFQSLVIRFEDLYIRRSDKLRGKSAYLFWKVFMLDGENTQEYEITKINDIPGGYKIKNRKDSFETKLWQKFWKYAFDPKEAQKIGIKNVQIEAPGTMFAPGMLYTLRIEHDGGIRIDAAPLPEILKGERIETTP